MYVVTFNDNVLLGPIGWNSFYFKSIIKDDTGIDVNIYPSDVSRVPIDFGNGIKIRLAVENKPNINNKIYTYEGPYWTFTEKTGTHSYNVIEKDVNLVKGDLISLIADERWTKEISGCKMTINNNEVTIDTSRGVRENLYQQYLLLNDNQTIEWKFPELWLTLTKAELGSIVNACNQHVQEAFNWELSKIEEVKLASTLVELDNIIIKQVEETESRVGS